MIAGTIAFKNVKKSTNIENFRFTIQHILISIIVIFLLKTLVIDFVLRNTIIQVIFTLRISIIEVVVIEDLLFI